MVSIGSVHAEFLHRFPLFTPTYPLSFPQFSANSKVYPQLSPGLSPEVLLEVDNIWCPKRFLASTFLTSTQDLAYNPQESDDRSKEIERVLSMFCP